MAIITYREAIRQALTEEMEANDRVFLLGEDIGAYGGTYAVTKGFLEKFGDKRVKDTPISEAAIVGAATGAAMLGLRPVAELMSINFTLVAIDQIVNHAAKFHYMFEGQMSVPAVFRTAAGWGQLAATHSQTFENWYSYIPGLKVVMPGTAKDAKGLLKAAIRDQDPVLFIEHSLLYGVKDDVPDNLDTIPIGLSERKREGNDVTIVSWSRMLQESMKAAAELEKDGISCEVIDLRTLRPLDMGPVYESVKKTNRAVVAEEGWVTCGMGAEIAARIQEFAFDDLDSPVLRVGAKEVPAPYAKNIEHMAFPHANEVAAAVRAVLA